MLSTDRLAPAGLANLEPLALLSVLCFMPLAVYAIGTPLLVVLAGTGTVVLIGAALAAPWRPMDESATRTIVGASVLAALSLLMTVLAAFNLATLFVSQTGVPFLIACMAALIVWYIVFRTDASSSLRWIGTGVIVGAVAATSYSFLTGIPVPGIDVFTLHRLAAEALANGENPYLVAQTFSSTPLAPTGTLIEGYAYPPLPLFAYSLSEWVLGDPRWTSALAMAAAVVLVAAPWASWTTAVARVRLVVALLFATAPGFGVVAFFSWTEPLALPFLVLAGQFWRSRPVVSAVALGLALATKQYFVLALPLLLLWPDEWRWKRIAITGGVVFATLLPFLLVDAGALLDALLGNTAFAATPRADSSNLVHLGILTPRWIAVGAAVAIGLYLGRRGGGGYRFVIALAAVLAVSFFLGVAAFRNYWFLVATMTLIGVALRYGDQDDVEPVSDTVREEAVAEAA